jgi:hypothetical protein
MNQEIINIRKMGKLIHVETYEFVAEIKTEEFETWVEKEQKREWLEVFPDKDGEPLEMGGIMTWTDYYASPYFRTDMEEFVSINLKKKIA